MDDRLAVYVGGGRGAQKYAVPAFKERKKRRIACVFAGILLGAVNGLFGSGGGMLAVPALSFLMSFDQKSAHATAIAVILPLCAISSAMYLARASFDMGVVALTSVGVFAGGILGALILKKLPSNALSFLFYGVMLAAGARMAAG